MLKLVCVDNTDREYLTVGKIYESNGGPEMYRITCDDDVRRFFSTSRFITLEEFRNRKLKSIGI
jgi:hypothetical protein